MTSREDIRNELLATQNRLSSNLNRSIIRLNSKFQNFLNPLTRLSDAINRADKTNVAALKIGVTNEKLSKSVEKNSNLLSRNLTSNNELRLAIIDGFGRGVRVQTDALDNLTTEIIATGQDVTALNKLNSDLVLFTGNNIQSLDNAAKVNKEVSDAYGVSNDKLINTLNSLRDTLQTASFFGSNAVDSLGEVATELTGRAGGTDITGALATLNKILVGGLDTERTAQLLGATGQRQTLAAGGRLNLQQVLPIFDQLEARRDQLGGGRFGLDILSQTLGISKSQTAELLNLAEIARQDFKVQDELKKTTDETYNSIENINKRAQNFYDNTAIGMLGQLGSINTNILIFLSRLTLGAGAAGSILGGASQQGPKYPMTPKQAIRTGGRGPIGAMSRDFMSMGTTTNARLRNLAKRGIGGTGAALGAGVLADSLLPDEIGGIQTGGAIQGMQYGAMIGSFIPGLGTMVGGGIGAVLGLIASNTGKSAEELAEQRRIADEERQRRRAEEAARDMSRLDFLAGYIRSRGGSFMTDPEMKALFEAIKTAVEKTARNAPTGSNLSATRRP
ncbi:MAG: hypothetical protein CL605_02475 [Altibacter sp.]|uniref:hypothetical protein n=1 Tax=Altibacter sp. TaxID=2024823 RepID=UPI000C90B7CE|nr:hypothetical protein [Altibacter sp.]MAP53747.1 hypothetical protein [Altibacter sp.]|tara:strand:+ start:8065 stop:9750 length:1686 start_codon:yes stop_codon:yes gene_type:complete